MQVEQVMGKTHEKGGNDERDHSGALAYSLYAEVAVESPALEMANQDERKGSRGVSEVGEHQYIAPYN